MFCTRCGQQNPPDAHFCARCGQELLRPGGPVSGERLSETTTTLSPVTDGTDPGDAEPAEIVTDSEARAAVEALPFGSALLVVKRGPNAGSRFLLDRDLVTAGRHPDSDIFLDDVTVSRRHAEFRRTQEGRFTVVDVGSLNGTYLKRGRIDSAMLLGSGDEVQIGKFRLTFFAAPPQQQ
ncbi:MAG TPA: FHA domain-containing protein [Frankiaceae bacterium]|nr:FHA domain-containing protein [Frankiaceae bacterium]